MSSDLSSGNGVVEAALPGGTTVRIRVIEQRSSDLGSVGLSEKLYLKDALAQVAAVAAAVRETLEPAMPSKATVEFGVSFAVTSGKLSSLIFEGKGEASLTVTLEWERDASA